MHGCAHSFHGTAAGKIGGVALARTTDHDVRRALLARAHSEHDGDPDTLIIEELGLLGGAVRVDVAVLNGAIVGTEIKSDADTLDRLPAQAEAYGRVLDYASVVCGLKKLPAVSDLLPSWWGVEVAELDDEGVVQFAPVRPMKNNPDVDLAAQAMLLWRDELLDVLVEHGIDRGYRSATRAALAHRAAEGLQPEILGSAVRRRIRARIEWRGRPSRASGDGSQPPAASSAGSRSSRHAKRIRR